MELLNPNPLSSFDIGLLKPNKQLIYFEALQPRSQG